MKRVTLIFITVICLFIISCSKGQAESKENSVNAAKDTLPYLELGKLEGEQIIVDRAVDLKDGVCILPEGITLKFDGGIIKNGTLIGSMTKLDCKENIFLHVSIKGNWDVPNITTKMFADLSYENALKDVVALTHPKVKNRVIIEKGNYVVSAKKGGDVCLPIVSNTEVVMNGTIKLLPNSYKMYEIIRVSGKNISINGNGIIIGDKHSHTGTKGEWGMGIFFRGAVNTSVSGLTIKDCWGDCIYVGKSSKDVVIENCWLDHGRRQGISVTKADGVTIRNCKITNVGGTAPEYAIDIEPNANDTVDHILIENVEVENCRGGFMAYKGNKYPRTTIGDIVIRNCSISATDKYPIILMRSRSALVEECVVNVVNEKAAIYTNDVQEVAIMKNTINLNNDFLSTFRNAAKRVVGKKAQESILVDKAEGKVVKDNIINGK